MALWIPNCIREMNNFFPMQLVVIEERKCLVYGGATMGIM